MSIFWGEKVFFEAENAVFPENLVKMVKFFTFLANNLPFLGNLSAEILLGSPLELTAVKYVNEFRHFEDWATENGRNSAPPSTDTFLLYFVVLLHRTNSFSRVHGARSSIGFYVNNMLNPGQLNPVKDPKISALVSGMSKCYSKPV